MKRLGFVFSSDVKLCDRAHQRKPPGYWENDQNKFEFLNEIKKLFNIQQPEDWNAISHRQIKENGGRTLLKKYSMYELKCMACPEGKSIFNKPNQTIGYWENKKNILQFLEEIKEKENLKSPDDWNLITYKQIKSYGGWKLLRKYSLYELKCMACPEGKSIFNKPNEAKPSGYWENKNNILKFLNEIKEKYNLKTPDDWNSITQKQITNYGGWSLFDKYSLYEIKCMACPEGISIFSKPKTFWDEQNIFEFLDKLKEKYNLETPDDWNSVSIKQIQHCGGNTLLHKYSLHELKCMACPEGKAIFDSQQEQKPSGYWNDTQNVLQFLKEIQQQLDIHTMDDWNSISHKHIRSSGGTTLLKKHSMYELKCMACPEGKSIFNPECKPPGYWDDKQNILEFLDELKEEYNLKTPEDWDSISTKQIKSHGGSSLLYKYSLYELKCMACPDGKSIFNKPKDTKTSEYWEDERNRIRFFEMLKIKYNLKTPMDWKRISKNQITSLGGQWLFYSNNNYLDKTQIEFEIPDKEGNKTIQSYNLKNLISESIYKRSSQRWLFLQVQQIFPGEEIVEDYFHSEISRESGCSVQFDVFLIDRNIAIEYHGKQHYEDLPSGFATLEMYKNRDIEKENLCKKYGIKLLIIPYWWDNTIESLRETLQNKLKEEK